MKKLKAFLENNYKKITIVSIILGCYLILKLFLIGAHTGGCGGGWINICIVPSFEYYFISASYIAIIFLGISIYLINRIKKIDNKIKKIQIAFLILILGFIGKPLFYLVSPDFKFYLNDAVYKDSDNNLVDIDKYLEEVNKYCINDSEFKYYQSREDMCGGKFEPDLKTVDEYIKVFESAKKNNNRYLYYLTYRWADENVGLENIIKKYNDDTFYAYVIKNEWTDNHLKLLIRAKTNNKNLLTILNYIDNKLNIHYKEVEINSENKGDKWDKIMKEIEIKIDNSFFKYPEINYKVF